RWEAPGQGLVKEKTMTRSSVLSGMLAVLLACGGCASMAGPAGPGNTLDRIKASKTVTLGYRESSTPFSFAGPDGKPLGYSIDFCDRVVTDLRRDLQLPDLAVKWVPVTVE